MNVYAGLAGAYLIADPADQRLMNLLFNRTGEKLPQLFPLVVQDRMFDTNGQLFFPADSAGGVLWTTNPEHPYWVPEFVGDTIVVNGKSWPFMNVEPRRYTFMFINGSNARTYEMSLTDPVSKNPGPPLWVIGTDGGYLDTPVKIDPVAVTNNVLPMMSGERYWVIVDFKGYEAGVIGPNGLPYSGKWLLKNNAKTPYPAGAAPQGSTVGPGRSRLYQRGDSVTVERGTLKRMVAEHQIRVMVATDAACEGLNLQTLGTLINVDLPWNPTRLEQRAEEMEYMLQKLVDGDRVSQDDELRYFV